MTRLANTEESHYFTLTFMNGQDEKAGTDTDSEEKNGSYTRKKSESDANDPKVVDMTEKKGTETVYTTNGYITYNIYWKITEVESESEEWEDDDGTEMVTIKYKYKILKKDAKVYTETEGLVVPTGDSIQLHHITFNRKLYKPNEIVADVKFSNSLTDDYLASLLGKRVVLTRYSKASSTATEVTEETFSGFYVHDLLPLKISGENLCIRFHIYSLDHQLTLRKYSRTYVAKKLMADILLEDETKDAKKNKEYTDVLPWYNNHPTKLRCPFNTYFKIPDNKTKDGKTTKHTNYAPFDNLNYSIVSSDKKTTTCYEPIQPYLVQYNESFYDFMARTANRCGEFFFWDDGALRLGRTCDDSDKRTDIKLDTSIANNNCLSVYYTSVNTPSGEGTSFETKYLTLDDLNDNSSNAPTLNQSLVGSDINPIKSNKDYYCNAEINHDVYRTRVYKDRFDSLADETTAHAARYGLGIVAKALEQTSVYDIIQNVAIGEALAVAAASSKADGVNNMENDRIFKEDDKRPNRTEREVTDEKKENSYINSFSTADTSGHLTSSFYDKIRSNEENRSKRLITFNLSSPKKFRLGQIITYNDKKYAIVQIKTDLSANPSLFSTIDAAAEEEFKNLGDSPMQVIAVPVEGTVYPPISVEHVRRSEPQIAFVAEFHDPQKRGRVRITYPWQNESDTEASPWIRVLTPSSTEEGGCSFELGVGDEVLIDYEAGNVERPYVAGTLYNRKNAIPYHRGDMALISKNGHGITFDDPIDSTKFLAGVSPAYNFVHQFLHPFSAGSPAGLKFTGGITLTDAYGFYKIQMSTDQRRIDINSPFGQVNIGAFTGITISAPNGDIKINGQNVSIEAGNAVKITSGLNIKQKGYFGAIWGDGSDKGVVALSGIADAFLGGIGDVLSSVTQLIDLDLLRKIVQVFLRPIDGTLEIKSYKYLLLEAGKGEATVRPSRYKGGITRDGSHVYDTPTYSDSTREHLKKQDTINALNGYISAVDQIGIIVDALFDNIKIHHSQFLDAKRTYQTTAANAKRTFFPQNDHDLKSGDTIVTEQQGVDDPTEYDKASLNIPDNVDVANPPLKTTFDNLKASADDLALKAYRLLQLHTTIPNVAATALPPVDPTNVATKYYQTISDKAQESLTAVLDNVADWKTIKDNQVDNLKVLAKKTWFANVFGDATNTDFNTNGKTLQPDGSNWAAFVAAIQEIPNPADLKANVVDSAVTNLTAFLTQYRDAWNETIRDRDHWDTAEDGQIIYSDQEHTSYYFDSCGSRQSYANGTDNGITISALQKKLLGWV